MPPAIPQPIEDLGNGMRRTRCPYTDCHKPITFEEGKAQLVCPGCTRVVRVQAAEERPPIPTGQPKRGLPIPPPEKPVIMRPVKPPENPPEKPPEKPPEEKPPAPEKK